MRHWSKECGELVLAALLQFGIIDEKFLDRQPLQRVNEVVRQKKGSICIGLYGAGGC